MKPILDIRNLSFSYGEHSVLENIFIKIEALKVTAILGDSGSGKSTFLSILSLLFREDSNYSIKGSIFFDKKDILSIKKDFWKIRRNIVYIAQKPNPLHSSIYKNLNFPLKITGNYHKKDFNLIIENGLKQVNLWKDDKDRLHKSALNLSGGQQQKLCIARALMLDPKIILFDEPTSSLDSLNKLLIEDLIQKLRKTVTIIFVSHDNEQITRLADSVYHCHNKNIVKLES